MKILLFGANRRVGNSVANKALDKGHLVIAFIRNKNKQPPNNWNRVLAF